MSEQEQLPVCALCGHEPAWTPAVPERWVCCTHRGCICAGWDMPETMWRRLMARPRLAPEHVASLRDMLNFCEQYTRDHPIPRAIRAALAALVEEWP